jgi:replicative DNA helicase
MNDNVDVLKLPRVVHVDIDAEKAVIASVLLENSVAGKLMALVRPDDFSSPVHELLWDVVGSLVRNNRHVDELTILAEVQHRNRINTIGGRQYLSELTEYIPTTAHCEDHAIIVAGCARARRARQGYADAIAILDRGGNPDHCLADARTHARRFDMDRPTKRRTMLAHIEHAWTRIESAAHGRHLVTPTGFPGFDGTRNVEGVTGGMHPDQMWVLAADQGFGKTTWAMQVARYVASTGRIALVFSLEMSGDSLALRMACGDTNIPMQSAVNGRLDPDAFARLATASQGIADLTSLRIIDDCNTMEEIESECLAAFAENESIGLIVIDYAQIVRPSKDDARKSTVDQISAVSSATKRLARRGKCPVLLLSQFSREGQKQEREPRPGDLKGSGSLESDADVIVFLWQERGQERQREESTTAIVAKNRMGDVGKVPMVFQRYATRFVEVDGSGGIVPAAPVTRVAGVARRPVREIGEVYIPVAERGDLRERPSPRESMVMDTPHPVDEGDGLPDCDGPAYIPPSPLFDGIEDDGTSMGFDAVGDS